MRPWLSWLAPPEPTAFRRQGLFTLTIFAASLFVLGLERQPQKANNDSLFIHLEDQQQFLHFEGRQTSGEPKVWRKKGAAPTWPELNIQDNSRDIEIRHLSQLSQWPKNHSLIFYDAANPKLPPKIWFNSAKLRKMVILLDRSGTMKKGDKGQPTPLTQAHLLLSKRRQESTETWRLYSFSDQLFDHGHWDIGKTAPPQMFEPMDGKTPLLAHLEELFQQNTEAVELVIISDGRLDTRDENSIKSQMEQWNRAGHRVHMLSPTGHPLESWRAIAASGLISDKWPRRQKVSSQGRSGRDRVIPCLWENVRPSSAKQELKAILWDREGEVLVYSDSSTAEEVFHVVAEPKSPSSLRKWLQQRQKWSPSLHFYGDQLTIHLPSAGAQVPTCPWPSLGIESLDSQRFRLKLPSKASSLSFFHPSCGSFVIDGLSRWQTFLDKHKKIGRRRDWTWHWPETSPQGWRHTIALGLLGLYALSVLAQLSYRRSQQR